MYKGERGIIRKTENTSYQERTSGSPASLLAVLH